MPVYSALSGQELLQRLRAGDKEAFTEIYNRYWEKLLAIGYYHTRHKQEAEDIVHDVMISLWTRRTELEIHSLNAYLGTAVKFTVFKAIARIKKRKHLLTSRTMPEHFSDIEEKLEERFLEEYLHRIIEQLPQKSRIAFHYSRTEELSVAETAGKMDLSPKAVEYHITKALKAIRKSLQKIKIFFI